MASRYLIIFGILLFSLILILVNIWEIHHKQRRERYIIAGINAWLLLIFFLGMTILDFYTNRETSYYIIPILLMLFLINRIGFDPKFKRKV